MVPGNRALRAALGLASALMVSGCVHPRITAVSLDPVHFGRRTGIPFYLPKPLLIVAKNFRNIEEAKVGLTDSAPIPESFDDQAQYANLNARATFTDAKSATGEKSNEAAVVPRIAPGPAPRSEPRLHSARGAPVSPQDLPDDGLAPDTFFTYHIVFVPDLSQKYGLKVRGGVGEVRAALNLVNGWQFTGMGPFYMKDSATAQNLLASGVSARLTGQGVADVVKSVADLGSAPGLVGQRPNRDLDADDPRVQKLARSITALPLGHQPMTLPRYAEIHVFEPRIGYDGQMEWVEIASLAFDRQVLGLVQDHDHAATDRLAPERTTQATPRSMPGAVPSLAERAVASALGLPRVVPGPDDRPPALEASSPTAALGPGLPP